MSSLNLVERGSVLAPKVTVVYTFIQICIDEYSKTRDTTEISDANGKMLFFSAIIFRSTCKQIGNEYLDLYLYISLATFVV